MKPYFHKISNPVYHSFSVRHEVADDFGKIWHYHPELELHFTIKGEGVRFIGDNISNFSAGEVILLGENLPHTWHCRSESPAKETCLSDAPAEGINAVCKTASRENANDNANVEAIVIQFLPDCLGRDFLALPEAYLIPRLFEKAKKGILLTGKTRKRVADLMRDCLSATNLDRLLIFLSILKQLAESTEYTCIASAHAFYRSTESETLRLNKICNYTLANYKKEITLEQIAALSNLSVSSFCRYFKRMTKKTYYDFLVEIRISHACRLLIEDRLPAGIVCFECGFNNISNFYRHFRKITGVTPLEYKRKYLVDWIVS